MLGDIHKKYLKIRVSLIDKSSAKNIYRPMIQPIFTYCGTLGLCWPRFRKRQINEQSIERRSSKVIGGNHQVQTIDNFIKKQTCQFVFDCLQDTVCTPFKGYFHKTEHNINTRNNESSLRLPKVKLEFGRKSFAFQGALIYNSLPLEIRNIHSRLLFRSNLKEIFS